MLRRRRRCRHQAATHVPKLPGELSLELASSIKYDSLRRAEGRDPNLQPSSETTEGCLGATVPHIVKPEARSTTSR
eukprot:6906755-Pyramimonas_sp.AAC.1